MRTQLTTANCWVVKIGSSLMTNNGLGLDTAAMADWTRQLVTLRKQGKRIVLVSSGAVAEGITRLGLSERPKTIHAQQAAAAVGQMGLVQAWESCFQHYQCHTAQILLTHDDLGNRKRYLNARSTLTALLDLDVVPVINENDSVATAELCFGDNDTLAALVANLVNADALVILTDQQGLHHSDPRENPDATLVREASVNDASLASMVGSSKGMGRGGMITKLSAARLAARSGTFTVIAGGREKDVLIRLSKGDDIGTLLVPDNEPVAARKQWIAGQLISKGSLLIDSGAVKVLQNSGRSLLPVGVKSFSGIFGRGDVVTCVDETGNEVARGLVNYDSEEMSRIIGCSSDRIEELLGYQRGEELIHRDNLVLLD